MSGTDTDSSFRPGGVAIDVVSYLIVVMPNLASLAKLVPALAELVGSGMMRILDVVVLERDVADAISVFEPDAVDSLAALAAVEYDGGGLLSERDLEFVSLALRPGTVGVVLVVEDRWALSLAAAARQAGGEIVAGERVPSVRVEAVLADAATRTDATEPDPDEQW